jgi:hypothetical protein
LEDHPEDPGGPTADPRTVLVRSAQVFLGPLGIPPAPRLVIGLVLLAGGTAATIGLWQKGVLWGVALLAIAAGIALCITALLDLRAAAKRRHYLESIRRRQQEIFRAVHEAQRQGKNIVGCLIEQGVEDVETRAKFIDALNRRLAAEGIATEAREAVPPKPVGRVRPRQPPLAASPWKSSRRRWLPMTIGAAVAIALGVLIWLQSRASPWETFRCPDGSFMVDFPSTPGVSQRPWAGDAAVVAHGLALSDPMADEFFSVEYLDPPPAQTKDPDSLFAALASGLLERTRDAARRNDLGEVERISEKPVAFGGNRGHELRAKCGSHLTITARWVIAKGRLYCLTSTVHDDHAGENDARFHASFRLLPQ